MRDCAKYRRFIMDLNSDSVSQRTPQLTSRRVSGGHTVKEVFGFPVDQNQFSTLEEIQPAVSQRSVQEEEGLVDPKKTRLLRWTT